MISFTTVGLIGLGIAWWKVGFLPTLLIAIAGTMIAGIASLGAGSRQFLTMIDQAVAGSARGAVGAILVDHHQLVAQLFALAG